MGPNKNFSQSQNRLLAIILGILSILIIGLVIGIIVVVINNSQEDSGEEPSLFDKYGIDCSDLSKLDDSSAIIDCIQVVYDGGDEQQALSLYKSRIDQALSDKEYQLYADLLVGRIYLYYEEDQCEPALQLIKQDNPDILPANERGYYYGEVLDVIEDCSDDEAMLNSYIDKYYQAYGEEDYDGQIYK